MAENLTFNNGTINNGTINNGTTNNGTTDKKFTANQSNFNDAKYRDIDEILYEKLWISNEKTAFNYQLLKNLGIKQILTIGSEIKEHTDPYFTTMRINIYDTHVESIFHWFEKTNEFINAGPTLVHCVMGISRSSTLVLAYVMFHKKLNLKDAFNFVYKKRQISPNLGFLAELVKYEKTLLKANNTDANVNNTNAICVDSNLSNRTKCDNCDSSDSYYFFPYIDFDKKSYPYKTNFCMFCAKCTGSDCGHILNRVCYSVGVDENTIIYKNQLRTFNKNPMYDRICNMQIGNIDMNIHTDFTKFHNNLNIYLKPHPTIDGYIENPLLYADLVYMFHTQEYKTFTVFYTKYDMIAVMFSILFDKICMNEIDLQTICKKNSQILINLPEEHYEFFGKYLNKILQLIKEFIESSTVCHYVPAYIIDANFDNLVESLEKMEKKYPNLSEESNKIKKLQIENTTTMGRFVEMHQNQGNKVIYNRRIYGKYFYEFIREIES